MCFDEFWKRSLSSFEFLPHFVLGSFSLIAGFPVFELWLICFFFFCWMNLGVFLVGIFMACGEGNCIMCLIVNSFWNLFQFRHLRAIVHLLRVRFMKTILLSCASLHLFLFCKCMSIYCYFSILIWNFIWLMWDQIGYELPSSSNFTYLCSYAILIVCLINLMQMVTLIIRGMLDYNSK
jgi:hypothetical protein